VAELVAAIDRLMAELAVPFGPNDFLGTRTRRLFNRERNDAGTHPSARAPGSTCDERSWN
jgi:hypothetical protein